MTKDTAYVMYEISKCNDQTRDKTTIEGCDGLEDDCTVDPPCAAKDDLDAWLLGKKIAFRVINNSVNLRHDEIDNLIQ